MQYCTLRIVLLSCFFLFFSTPDSFGVSLHKNAQGIASWYGGLFHGKKTASGETYNRNDFTAAHKQLPFGIVLRVHSTESGKHVLVQTTDRGPFHKRRIIDLSKRAAKQLDMLSSGTAKVVLEQVTDNTGKPLNSNNAFFVRLSDSMPIANAKTLSSTLSTTIPQTSTLKIVETAEPLAIVCTGPFQTFNEARERLLDLNCTWRPLDIIEAPADNTPLPLHLLPEKLPISVQIPRSLITAYNF